MTSDVRRDVLPRSSQCGGGEVADPTAPALDRSAVSRSKSALSPLQLALGLRQPLRELRVGEQRRSPYSRGRSNGTLSSASLLHVPCRSGSPHGVFGAADCALMTTDPIATARTAAMPAKR